MPNILVFIDGKMARALEKVAPARSRERSRFIRLALQKALMELNDEKSAPAYERMPDDEPDDIALGKWDRYMPADLRKQARAARGRSASRARKPKAKARAKR